MSRGNFWRQFWKKESYFLIFVINFFYWYTTHLCSFPANYLGHLSFFQFFDVLSYAGAMELSPLKLPYSISTNHKTANRSKLAERSVEGQNCHCNSVRRCARELEKNVNGLVFMSALWITVGFTITNNNKDNLLVPEEAYAEIDYSAKHLAL